MVISIATFISTFIFGAVMIIILAILLNNKITYSYIGLRFLTLFSWIVIIRLLLPFEIPSFTITVSCTKLMPTIRNILLYSFFRIWNYDITVLNILVIIWILGVIYYNYRLFKTYRKFLILTEFSDADSASALVLLNTLRKERGIQQEIRLKRNGFITTPSITGFKRATILLPNENFSNEELFCIFNHELNHYQHHDNISKLILEIINSLYWWNPLFYLLKAQISTVFEFKADAGVIKQMKGNSVIYLECLLNIYKRQFTNRASNISTAFCAVDKKKLTQRFTYIAQRKQRYRENIIYAMIICLCLLAGSFSLVFEAYSILPQDARNTYSLYDADSAYLLVNSKGKYILYINGKWIGEVTNPSAEEVSDLPIYYSEKEIP